MIASITIIVVKSLIDAYAYDMSIKMRGFSVVEIVIIIVIIGVIGSVAVVFLSRLHDGERGGQSSAANTWFDQCSGSGQVTMTHLPMDMSDVQSVIPIGFVTAEHVTPIDHLYFYPKDMTNRDAAPVYAMADGYIVDYQERTQNVGDGSAKAGGEYRIVIQHNCSVASYFDLLTSLDSSIRDQLKPGSGQRIAVKAGQEIGRVGAQSLDTAIYNFDKKLSGFVNPDSYASEPWKIHTDDFFSYFDSSLQNQMLALNPRTAEPRSGKIDYDQKGKLIGNWFKKGTNGYAGSENMQGYGQNGKGYWSGHLSIAPDVIYPDITNLSFGDYQGRAKQFTFKSGSVDPADVDASSGMIKIEYVQYANPNPGSSQAPAVSDTVLGTILVQLIDGGDTLRLEAFDGKSADQVSDFTDQAAEFVR